MRIGTSGTLLRLMEDWMTKNFPKFTVVGSRSESLTFLFLDHKIDLVQTVGTTNLTFIVHCPGTQTFTGTHSLSAADPDFFNQMKAILKVIEVLAKENSY